MISLEVVETVEIEPIKEEPVADFVDDILQLSEAELSSMIDKELEELLKV